MLFIVTALLIVVVVGVIAYGVFGEPYRPAFKRHRLDLPDDWPGLSVLHISDLHVRSTDLRLWSVQRAALRKVPRPDLVCVTGDVCEKVADIPLLIALLQTIRPRLGTFLVLGNHEHNAPLPAELRNQHTRGWQRLMKMLLHVLGTRRLRSDGPDEGHAMADALRAAGITVLHNEGVRIHHDGVSLWIAGCDSAWAGHPDMAQAMSGRRPDEACLALIHEPDLAFEAAAYDADLILAGHTHGGQVRIPFLGAPYTLRMDPRITVASGFQRIGDSLLHITAGLGHIIPLRFGCPPEIVWLECAAVIDSSTTSASLLAA